MSRIIALTISSLLVGGQPARGATDHCRSADSWSANTTTYLQRIVTGTGAGSIKLRAGYKLPYVTSTPSVVLVTDDSLCATAVTAVENLYTDSLSRSPVWVFRIGTTHYAVSDRPELIYIFDNNFTRLAILSEVDQ